MGTTDRSGPQFHAHENPQGADGGYVPGGVLTRIGMPWRRRIKRTDLEAQIDRLRGTLGARNETIKIMKSMRQDSEKSMSDVVDDLRHARGQRDQADDEVLRLRREIDVLRTRIEAGAARRRRLVALAITLNLTGDRKRGSRPIPGGISVSRKALDELMAATVPTGQPVGPFAESASASPATPYDHEKDGL